MTTTMLRTMAAAAALWVALSGVAGAANLDSSPPPSALYEVAPVAAVMRHELEPIFPELLLAEDAAAAEGPAPRRFAVPADVTITPATHGTWEYLPDGGRLWRLHVIAPNATDLNFGFTRFRLPPGATLHLVSLDHEFHQGPYTAADNRDHGELWTPVIPGERAVVELYVPAEPPFQPELELGRIGRGYRDWFGRAGIAKQGSCNIDVVCPEADDWRDEIQSVALYSKSAAYTCTGSLVMDAERSFRPYFLTAWHCNVNEFNDQTVVTYWNYQSPECGDLSGGDLGQTVSGATLVARRQDNDFALLELDAAPPPEFNPYWSGWDRRTDHIPQGSVGIHHPKTDEKAISFNDDPLTIRDNCLTPGPPDTHWEVDNWEQGTTEAGSSGSGLWDPDTHLLVGYLSGGWAACGNDLWDCYGRFAIGWDGDAPEERLRDWLDPDDIGVETVVGSFLGGGGGGGSGFSCGNAGYDDGMIGSAAYFGGGFAGDPDLMFAVRFALADFGYTPGEVRLTGFCATNQLEYEGGPWPNEVFVYPDSDGLPDEVQVLAQSTITTGDGTGDSVITLAEPVTLDGDFWLVVRGDPKHTGEDFNVEFDAGPNTGHSYLSDSGIAGLTTDNGPEDYPEGVNYALRATLEPIGSGPEYLYLLAGMANTPGAEDSDFRSKLMLVNRSGGAATVTLSYVRAAKTATTTIVVPDRELRTWDNVVVDLFGVAGSSAGAVKVESDRPLVVTARTYNVKGDGTLGQFLPGVTLSETLTEGETGVISLLRRSTLFRSNLGFVSLSEFDCQARVKLYSDFGAQIGATRTYTTPAMGWVQENDIFGAVGVGDQENAYAVIEALTPNCRIWGYGSLVDNPSGDPTTVPMVIE